MLFFCVWLPGRVGVLRGWRLPLGSWPAGSGFGFSRRPGVRLLPPPSAALPGGAFFSILSPHHFNVTLILAWYPVGVGGSGVFLLGVSAPSVSLPGLSPSFGVGCLSRCARRPFPSLVVSSGARRGVAAPLCRFCWLLAPCPSGRRAFLRPLSAFRGLGLPLCGLRPGLARFLFLSLGGVSWLFLRFLCPCPVWFRRRRLSALAWPAPFLALAALVVAPPSAAWPLFLACRRRSCGRRPLAASWSWSLVLRRRGGCLPLLAPGFARSACRPWPWPLARPLALARPGGLCGRRRGRCRASSWWRGSCPLSLLAASRGFGLAACRLPVVAWSSAAGRLACSLFPCRSWLACGASWRFFPRAGSLLARLLFFPGGVLVSAFRFSPLPCSARALPGGGWALVFRGAGRFSRCAAVRRSVSLAGFFPGVVWLPGCLVVVVRPPAVARG